MRHDAAPPPAVERSEAGVGSGEYTEQVTCLLFLKLDDERVEEEGLPSLLPEACRWPRLALLGGAELARTYAAILDQLGREPGLIGAVYARARPTVEEPAHLKRLVGLIGAETWSAFGADVKGAIYEGLLERTASDIKSGTGQYFTPRPLIQAIVEVVDPTPCSKYADLNDHGEALRLTLTDGVSRHGSETGRGRGFRPLFIGIANLNGSLRFRSGDHALVIDGRNPSLVAARLAQKPKVGGFLASVKCLIAAAPV